MELISALKLKKTFVNLFNIYAHELSKYNSWIGTQIDIDGNYLSEEVEQYLNDEKNEAYCIIDENRPVGFVVFSYSTNTDENICDIAEIFLVETSRRIGISEIICKEFWRNHKGICRLQVLKANCSAVMYWEKLIKKCGYVCKKQDHDEQMWSYEFKIG